MDPVAPLVAPDLAPLGSPSAPAGRPPRSALALVAAALSAVVPGVGQLLRRRWVEAFLFVAAVGYLRLLLAGLAGAAAPDARLWGFLVGAFGVKGGLANPTFVVMTVLTFALHGLAAWDAARGAFVPVAADAPRALDGEVAAPAGLGAPEPAEEGKSGEVL
ncbi:MAG: hypothetical protein U1F43_30110 [Myxococcota bacterium]